MPFAKGNTLWKDSLKTRKERSEKILTLLFGDLEDGGAEQYGEKLEKLAKKKELTAPELDFMDRYEKLMEYLVPKLARTDLTSGGKRISGFGLGHSELKDEEG